MTSSLATTSASTPTFAIPHVAFTTLPKGHTIKRDVCVAWPSICQYIETNTETGVEITTEIILPHVLYLSTNSSTKIEQSIADMKTSLPVEIYGILKRMGSAALESNRPLTFSRDARQAMQIHIHRKIDMVEGKTPRERNEDTSFLADESAWHSWMWYSKPDEASQRLLAYQVLVGYDNTHRVSEEIKDLRGHLAVFNALHTKDSSEILELSKCWGPHKPPANNSAMHRFGALGPTTYNSPSIPN